MAVISGLAHVGVYVHDVEESKKFYQDILGMECIYQCSMSDDDNEYNLAFVKLNDVTLELIQRKVCTMPGEGVVSHVAFAVDDMEGIIENLKAKGIEFETEEYFYCDVMFPNGTKYIFFDGPNGERIELAQVL